MSFNQLSKFSFKNQKNPNLMVALLLILIILISYTLYINFSYYWDFLHSDIVADLAFIREAARSFSLFPAGWAHLNEMRFVYITTPAILFYWLTRNVHLAYSLAVSFMLIVNLALFYYMMSFKKRNIMAMFAGVMVLLMFFSRYTIFSVFSILFVNGSLSTHLATVFITLGVYLRTKYNKVDTFKWQKALWIITLLLAFAQGIQSTRMVIVLYVPLIFVEILPLLRSINNKSSQINGAGLLYACAAFALHLLGMLFIHLLTRNGAVFVEEAGLTFGLNLANTTQFIERTFQSMTTLFYAFGLVGGSGLFSIEGLIFIIRASFLFTLTFLYFQTPKDDADQNLVHVLITTLMFSTLSQAFITIGIGERFNFTATSLIAAIFIIVISPMIENVPVKTVGFSEAEHNEKHQLHDVLNKMLTPQRLQKYVAASLIATVLIGSLFSMTTLGIQRNANLTADRQRIVDFLLEEELTVGYGAFWQALAITGVANWEVVVIPFHSNLGVVGNPLRQGVAYHDFFHDEERVFLIGSVTHIEEAYDHHRMGYVLQTGQRHDFPGGWVVYIFDENHWATLKEDS
ncbi:MAG: hypothetical protein FWG67_05560 [Defluviitaleaceae bacterium]|nr:hypothetical protein [Defluviitaleaceae bacterium]